MTRPQTVACLAGDGVGPELMAQATRALSHVAKLHSVAVDEIHQRHLGLQRATLEEAAALDPGGDAQPAP